MVVTLDPGASDLGVYHRSAAGERQILSSAVLDHPMSMWRVGTPQERAFTRRSSASHRPCLAGVGLGGMGALIGPRGRRGASHSDPTERPSSVGGHVGPAENGKVAKLRPLATVTCMNRGPCIRRALCSVGPVKLSVKLYYCCCTGLEWSD